MSTAPFTREYFQEQGRAGAVKRWTSPKWSDPKARSKAGRHAGKFPRPGRRKKGPVVEITREAVEFSDDCHQADGKLKKELKCQLPT